MKNKSYQRRVLVPFAILFVLSLAISAPVESAPPLPGAIFTTLEDGTRVNANIFEEKCDVYLDGGPGPNAPADAAGLPDGDYFFQVTDPSGKILLSTDPVENRQFGVAGGIIIGLSGNGNHYTGVDVDNDAVTIQLCPFDDTPNPGGVYKVWVTPVEDFVGDPTIVDNGYSPGNFHGFIPSASKTDNFKVKGRGKVPCLTIIKFFDCDADGSWYRRGRWEKWWYEPEIFDWPIRVFDPNGAQINGALFTPVELCNLVPGDYTVIEAENDPPRLYNCTVTANILDGEPLIPPKPEVVVPIETKSRELVFGNICDGDWWK